MVRKKEIKQCPICNKVERNINKIYCSMKCYAISRIGLSSWNKGLTKENDERMIKISLSNQKDYLSKYGEKRAEEIKKKLSESSKGRVGWSKGKKLSKKTRQKMSECQIGEKNNFYGKTHNIETRKKMSAFKIGIPIEEWDGFISFKPYTIDFSKPFKESIRERDNHCCVICNKMQEEETRKLSIHHCDYDKLNSFPQNCVSLCRRCHAMTSHNRQHWKTFLQSLLAERYNYQYTQDQKIILDFVKGDNQ